MRFVSMPHFDWQFNLRVRGYTVLAWRRWGKDNRRLTVGPFEFGHGHCAPFDVLTPWGSLLTVWMKRNPATAVACAKQHHASGKRICRWMLLNNRLLFLGLGGDNWIEVAVWRRFLILAPVKNDMRICSAYRRKTPADVLADAPVDAPPPPVQ